MVVVFPYDRMFTFHNNQRYSRSGVLVNILLLIDCFLKNNVKSALNFKDVNTFLKMLHNYQFIDLLKISLHMILQYIF